ncbi:TolC family protein [Orbus mooreae]|uniref:TolC family protein n=1 Tax=Orbus mooreae TaxID=3074107 RepID=UPI00370CFF9C
MKNSMLHVALIKCRFLGVIFIIGGLSGCVSYSENWDHMPAVGINDIKITPSTINNDSTLTTLPSSINIQATHEYSLVELIDLSQNSNPQLRMAWQQAKQAAINSELIKTTFLPRVSANVVGGYLKNDFDLTDSIHVDTNTKSIIPNLSLQWLIFDFGQRSDLLSSNDHLVSALKYNFYLANQAFVQNVTTAYFSYNQIVKERIFAEQVLDKTVEIEKAVKKKNQLGLATLVEVAQAEQLVSESKLNHVLKKNNEKNSYQLLLKAMGLNPLMKINIKMDENRVLPKNINVSADKWIDIALANRPDILASYEMVKNTKANVSMIEKDYFPKVFLGGNLSRNHSNWGVQNFSDSNQTSNNSNVFLGIYIPLYSGGSSNLKIAQAKSLEQESIEQFNKIKNNAANEIVIAINTLNSELESYQSAINLTKTAEVTYNASFASYKQGFATITQVNESMKGLIYAKQIESQTYTASLIAASNLAFLLGFVTNSEQILNNRFLPAIQ